MMKIELKDRVVFKNQLYNKNKEDQLLYGVE